jgi:hypothetical protein
MSQIQTKTNYDVPFFHSNTRTEFRVASMDKVVLSNLRLCEFGCSQVIPSGTNPPEASYVRGAGLFALIKNIYLYSGSVIIDQMRDVSRFMGFKNLIMTSAEAEDLNRFLLCSNSANDLSTGADDEGNRVEYLGQLNKLIGRVPLSQIFSLLNATDFFNSWNDLRLVIEYNTDVRDIFSNTGSLTRPTGFVVNTPLLAWDELVMGLNERDVMLKEAKQVKLAYEQVERERWYIPANQPYFSQRLRAFDEKIVSRLVVQTAIPNTFSDAMGRSYSQPVLGEKINFVINGRKHLPYQGADTPNKKLAMCLDSFGDLMTFTGQNDIIAEDNIPNVYDNGTQATLEGANGMSLLSCDILNRVNTLECEFSRDLSVMGVSTLVELEMFAFGAVSMYLVKNADGSVQTGYV